MANFAINQVRHFYVALSNAASTPDTKGALQAIVEGNDLMFKYMSPGGLVSTDKIDIDKIMYAKYTPAEEMATTLKEAVVTPIADTVVVGQEYIVKVTFTNYAGAGDDNLTVKYGFAVAKTTSASDLLRDLAVSLAKNMKDLIPLASVHLATSDSKVAVTAATSAASLTGTYTALVIREEIQPWTVGVQPFHVVPFTVSTFPIVKNGVETVWTDAITVAAPTSGGTVINNGKKIADMEWFYTGARGDYYRNYGHPHGVTAELLVDSDNAYDTIDIHYAYVGPNEGAQKSEKTITIAAANSVAEAINNALASASVPGFTTLV